MRSYKLKMNLHPNKAIVIKNNPKEKDLGEKKLKKVRNMRFC